MKKISKIYVLMFLMVLFLLTSVNAFSINMNLEDSYPTDTTNIVEETLTEDDLSENEVLNTDIDNEETDNSSPRVTTTKSTDEDEFLTVENILSIIIIVIGLLLIFLAIAILIRIK